MYRKTTTETPFYLNKKKTHDIKYIMKIRKIINLVIKLKLMHVLHCELQEMASERLLKVHFVNSK